MRKFSDVEIEFGELEPSNASKYRAKRVVAAVEALHQACSPLQIQKSFKYAGLYPWDVDQALRNPRINPSETLTLDSRKKKGIQMDGRVITSKKFLDELKKHQEEEKTKKK